MKEKVNKIVGQVSEYYIKKFGLEKHQNKDIIQALSLYKHTIKHAEEFRSVDRFNNVMNNIDKILAKPYFVYFDKNKNSLRYYKYLEGYVCVIVKLTNKRELYVATVYPTNKEKIDKLKKRQSL